MKTFRTIDDDIADVLMQSYRRAMLLIVLDGYVSAIAAWVTNWPYLFFVLFTLGIVTTVVVEALKTDEAIIEIEERWKH